MRAAGGFRAMAGQFVTEVNDSNFEQDVLRSEQPVLVDFWASVVWTVPGACAGGGRGRNPLSGQAEGHEDGCRQEQCDAFPLWHSWDTSAAVVQGWQSSRSDRGLRAEGYDREIHHEGLVGNGNSGDCNRLSFTSEMFWDTRRAVSGWRVFLRLTYGEGRRIQTCSSGPFCGAPWWPCSFWPTASL